LAAFDKLGDLIRIGATGTNVNDQPRWSIQPETLRQHTQRQQRTARRGAPS
jgi:hypothetical protein